jgi:hypothetical protein
MASEDRCCWPGCRLESKINCPSGGKDHRLCDKHWELVASENKKTEAQSRKTVGLPPIEKLAGTMPVLFGPDFGNAKTSIQKLMSDEEETSGCSCKSCSETYVVTIQGKHLCDKHWDMWRSRKTERRWRVQELLGMVKETRPAFELYAEQEKEEPKEIESKEAESEALEKQVSEESVDDTDAIDDFASRLESGEFDM